MSDFSKHGVPPNMRWGRILILNGSNHWGEEVFIHHMGVTSQFLKGSQPLPHFSRHPSLYPTCFPLHLFFFIFPHPFSIPPSFKTLYKITHPAKVNLPTTSNTLSSPTPSHWRYLFPGTNHNQLNSDETNHTNIVVKSLGILGALYWYKY